VKADKGLEQLGENVAVVLIGSTGEFGEGKRGQLLIRSQLENSEKRTMLVCWSCFSLPSHYSTFSPIFVYRCV
jgi:hypothetical protein